MLFGGLDLIPTCSFPDLASILSLNWHGYDSRHFGALKKAIFSLEECYRALTNTAFSKSRTQFPVPRTYRSLETTTPVNIKYLHQIDEKELLFVGETGNGERICIEFVRRYSKAVHENCAEMGTAPKLRGFEDIGRQGISTLT